MTSLTSVTPEAADPTAAERFHTAAFGLGPRLGLRASDVPTAGFRGFALPITVPRPAGVGGFGDSALGAGATSLKPAAKSPRGYGGVVQAPDGFVRESAHVASTPS